MSAAAGRTPEVLAPDAKLRKPKRPLPAGTIDCHAHIFDCFERYPLAAGRKYQPPLCTREAWLALHEALGVARGVQVHGSPYGFDNSITEDFLKDHAGRFVGIAAIPPDIAESDPAIEAARLQGRADRVRVRVLVADHIGRRRGEQSGGALRTGIHAVNGYDAGEGLLRKAESCGRASGKVSGT